MNQSALTQEILSGLAELKSNDSWRRLFAEIVCYATFERFLQPSFLAAFHSRTDRKYLATVEYKSIDFAFVPIEDKLKWWQTFRPKSPFTQDQFVVGLAELKICYPITQDSPWYPYGAKAKASELANDVEKMKRQQDANSRIKELFAIMAISTFSPRSLPDNNMTSWASEYEESALADIDEAEGEFWERFEEKTGGIERQNKVGESWLLHREVIPSEPERRAYAKIIIVKV